MGSKWPAEESEATGPPNDHEVHEPMGTPSANKGARGEREVVELWQNAGFLQAQRARAGAELDRGDLAGIPGLTVEVKNVKNLTAAVSVGMAELAVEKANNRTAWGVLFLKRPRKGWVAMMPAEEFCALWAKVYGAEVPSVP